MVVAAAASNWLHGRLLCRRLHVLHVRRRDRSARGCVAGPCGRRRPDRREPPPLFGRVAATLGCLFCKETSTNLLPQGLSVNICEDWIFVGKQCSAEYGQCSGRHYVFDKIPLASDRTLIANHVASRDDLWFNEATVRSLTDATHKLKLGNSEGFGTP